MTIFKTTIQHSFRLYGTLWTLLHIKITKTEKSKMLKKNLLSDTKITLVQRGTNEQQARL